MVVLGFDFYVVGYRFRPLVWSVSCRVRRVESGCRGRVVAPIKRVGDVVVFSVCGYGAERVVCVNVCCAWSRRSAWDVRFIVYRINKKRVVAVSCTQIDLYRIVAVSGADCQDILRGSECGVLGKAYLNANKPQVYVVVGCAVHDEGYVGHMSNIAGSCTT